MSGWTLSTWELRLIPDVQIGTPLEEALRRDLIINAVFYNMNNGVVEDLTGSAHVVLVISERKSYILCHRHSLRSWMSLSKHFVLLASLQDTTSHSIMSCLNLVRYRGSSSFG